MFVAIMISVISIVVGVAVIIGFGLGEAPVGSFMILAIFGAPLTFLQKIFWIFGNSKIPLYGMFFLYFLQYQLIALFIYKFYDFLSIKHYLIIIAIIIFSAGLWAYLHIPELHF